MPIAYSYIRFSTPRQQRGDSFARQTSRAKQYAEAHGLELADLRFEDLGRSAFHGKHLARGGGLSFFLEAVELGKVARGSYLLVESLDRLSRAQPTEALQVLTDIVNAGVTVVTLMDETYVYSKDTLNRNPVTLLDSVLKLYAAHEESRKKSDRFTKLFERRRAENKKIVAFTAPGWLRKNQSLTEWELIPENAEIIRRFFNETLEGKGCSIIAKEANALNLPSLSGGKWQQAVISRILRSRTTIGEYQPTTRVNGKSTPIGTAIPDFYPAVISKDIFYKVAAVLDTRKKMPRRRDDMARNPFPGLLHCGACGAAMRLRASGKASTLGNLYYICGNREDGVTQNCPRFHAGDLIAPKPELRRISPRGNAHLIHSRALLAQVLYHISHTHGTAMHQSAYAELIETLKSQLTAIQIKKSRLLILIEDGDTDPELLARWQSLKAEEFSAKANLEDAQKKYAAANHFDEYEANEAIGESLSLFRDDTLAPGRRKIRERLLREVSKIWIFRGIAALKLNGDEFVRWLPLDPEKGNQLISSPPPLP